MRYPFVLPLLGVFGLSACNSEVSMPRMSLGEPQIIRTMEQAPPGAAPGTCWGKDVTPAVIETVTDQIMLQPAEVRLDGTITQPAIYKTETRQAIVKERRETWFETPCDDRMTPDFIATLQRALAARGHFRGAPTGEMDMRTRRAIRAYQSEQGLNSSILSMAAARKMGLIASHPKAE